MRLQRQVQRQDSVAEALEYPREQKRATRQGYTKMMQDEAGSGWSKGSQSVTEGSSKNNARPPTASGLWPLREKGTWQNFSLVKATLATDIKRSVSSGVEH